MMERTHTGRDGEVDNTKANAFKHSLWTALMTIAAARNTLGQTSPSRTKGTNAICRQTPGADGCHEWM
jgi:hypothetical protein